MCPHVRRISIVSCQSAPIYLRAICPSICQLLTLLSQDYRRQLCAHLSRKRLEIYRWLFNLHRSPVDQTDVPHWRTSSAILKGSKARSFSGACAPWTISHPFPCHPPHRDFPLGHKCQLMGKYANVYTDSSWIRLPIYDSYSSR